MLALSLTGGTLAGLSLLAPTTAFASTGPTCQQRTQTFAPGAEGTYTVPPGATSVDVVASGGSGADGTYSAPGGAGATVTTTLTVTPGEVLDYAVGRSASGLIGGTSGSAPSGGSASLYGGRVYGVGGGGATFVRTDGTVLVAAGAGGGGGHYSAGGDAGPASGVNASGVSNGGDGREYYSSTAVATGGSSVPGIGGAADGSHVKGYDGSGSVGGNAGDNTAAGGGGGGYKGGGGGGFNQGTPSSGGAGSSYVAGSYTIVANHASGSLTITLPVFQSAADTTFIQDQPGSFTVCAPGGPGTVLAESGALPAGLAFADQGDGTAIVSGTATESGDFPLTISSTTLGVTTTQTFALAVHDITAKTLEVTADPTSVTAGGDVTVTVTAYDAQHDVAATDEDDLALSSSDPMADLPAATLVHGVASFTATLQTAGTHTITVSDTGIDGLEGTTPDITVAPAVADHLTLTLPATTRAGDSADAVITAYDEFGNVATSDTAALDLESSDEDAVFQTPVSLTAGTVTVPVTFKNDGTETFSATDNDAGMSDQADTDVTSAATSTLDLTSPYYVVADSDNVVTVLPVDPYGNENMGDVLHFASTDPKAVLPADASPDSVGQAFSVTFKTAGEQTLTVTDVTHPEVPAATQTLLVMAGDAHKLASHGGDQQSARAAHHFSAPLSVLVTDAEGNPVPYQDVVFAVPAGSGSTFGGHETDTVSTDSHGVATADTLTAGTTPGRFTVTATSTGPGLVADGGTAFTETVTASDAAAASTPLTSSGPGAGNQSVTVPVPPGGSVTLIDASGQPVTTVVTPQGTYVLDPTTGVITFVAVAGFSGTATPVTYQVTDAYHLQATGTYGPTVTTPAPIAPPATPPLGVAKVTTPAHQVLISGTVPATCTVSVAAIKTCKTSITARVSGRQVLLGSSATVKAKAGATSVKTVVKLNKLGKALAAQVGGVKVTVWASVVKTDGRALSGKTAASLVDKHVVVAKPVLFLNKEATLSGQAKRDLASLKAHRGAVKTVTCVGYSDSVGTSAANSALGKARATAVCAALAGHGVKLSVVTRGDQHPAGDNASAAGRALNRRVEITFTY